MRSRCACVELPFDDWRSSRRDAAPQRRVLGEVAEVAGHRLLVSGHRLLLLAQGSSQIDDGTIGLELGERELEDLPGAIASELVDEVHGHVVGRSEAGVQRVAAPRGERGDRLGIEPLDPLDDRVSLDVDAASAGAARELGVLPRRDRHARLAVEFLELLEDHRAGGHVHAEREGLGREHDLQQLLLEQLLHDLLERRQHARVVRGDAALEPFEPFPVAQHRKILVAEHDGARFDDRADLAAFVRVGEPDAGTQHLAHGLIAPGSREDEHDRRQQVLSLQECHDVGAIDAALPLPALVEATPVAPASALARPAGDRASADAGELLELGVHPVRRRLPRRVEQVEQLRLDEHVLLERHGPLFGDDHVGVAAHRLQPVAELLGVRDGRAQRDEPHRLGQVDDDLFPDRTAEAVGEVVHLVHDDVGEADRAAASRRRACCAAPRSSSRRCERPS